MFVVVLVKKKKWYMVAERSGISTYILSYMKNEICPKTR